MSSKLILNNPKDTVVIFGKEFTVEQLQDALIDQAFLRGRMTELLGGK